MTRLFIIACAWLGSALITAAAITAAPYITPEERAAIVWQRWEQRIIDLAHREYALAKLESVGEGR